MPSRVSLPEGYARRIAAILAAAGERGDVDAEKAAAWLLPYLEAQACPSQDVRDRVNSIRPEWASFPNFDADEEYHFRSNEKDLAALKPRDWETMGAYLAYKPRDGESFFQVNKRLWFLKAPEETLQLSRDWRRTHCGRPRFIEKEEASTHPDTPITELLAEVFKGAAWKDE